ncbi:MAG: tRNA (guanosine(37)-N1)-methyltransferase TrmD [Planctomycetaceae bacterium]|jgi:tRNA (guanine37-N1)-methyltransferase|nr:tRNA (guanosine(37)-N1)-methyltransferase TrmD [Planctomycetaceae bacterium]
MLPVICFDVLTLFPSIFDGFLSESVLKRALITQKIEVRLHNMRDWAKGRHATMDDRPFGGGPGMLLKVDCVAPCVEEIQHRQEPPGRLLMFTPQGRCFNQKFAEELATEQRIVMLCGRYEGFDERVAEILNPEEVSIGDYILNGGEVAAMVVIEAVMRLISGILGDENSNRLDSFSIDNRILDCAHYTRPREYRGFSVPEILLSGNHAEIAQWRKNNSLQRTKEKRPDLLTPDLLTTASNNSPLKTETLFSQFSITKDKKQSK